MTLGQRMKTRRKQIRMTQKELATTLNKGESTISEWESNKRSPDVELLSDIATALNTTPAYLMGWEDDPEDYDQAEELDSLPSEWYSHFNGDTRQAVRAYRAMEQDRVREGSSGPALPQEEEKLLAAWRRADPVYKRVALELLESHPAEQESHAASSGMAT